MKNIKKYLNIIVTATILLFIGEIIGSIFTIFIKIIFNISDKYNILLDYLSFIGIIITIVLYLLLFKKDIYLLKKIKFKPSHFFIGCLIGFLLNSICALSAIINKDLSLSLGSFSIITLIISFLVITIQSTAEELVCRLFVYQNLRRISKSPLVWILVNSIFFGLLHIANDGVTILAIIDIIIYGIFMSLLVYYFDSIWLVSAIHTSWNFTQNIILGLPNSGIKSTISVYNIIYSKNSFFYDINFGVEGTLFCILLLTISTFIIYLLFRKNRKNIDNKSLSY